MWLLKCHSEKRENYFFGSHNNSFLIETFYNKLIKSTWFFYKGKFVFLHFFLLFFFFFVVFLFLSIGCRQEAMVNKLGCSVPANTEKIVLDCKAQMICFKDIFFLLTMMDPTVKWYLVSKPWWNLPASKMCENLTRPQLSKDKHNQKKCKMIDWYLV